jgi:hypothetical protein
MLLGSPASAMLISASQETNYKSCTLKNEGKQSEYTGAFWLNILEVNWK